MRLEGEGELRDAELVFELVRCWGVVLLDI